MHRASLHDPALEVSEGVADVENMGDTTLSERRAERLDRGSRAAEAAGGARRRPSALRVAATLAADAAALAVSAIFVAWIVAGLGSVSVIDRLGGPFVSEPGVGLLLFLALIPYWLAVLWAFGLYREPGRSIGGFNLGEALNGLTSLTSASWLLLIIMVLSLGITRAGGPSHHLLGSGRGDRAFGAVGQPRHRLVQAGLPGAGADHRRR